MFIVSCHVICLPASILIIAIPGVALLTCDRSFWLSLMLSGVDPCHQPASLVSDFAALLSRVSKNSTRRLIAGRVQNYPVPRQREARYVEALGVSGQHVFRIATTKWKLWEDGLESWIP